MTGHARAAAETRPATALRKNPTPRTYNVAGGHEKPAQSEADFQRQVIALARLRGFTVYHTYDARRSVRGFPDLVIARAGRDGRPGRCIFAELKSETGRVTLAQRQWLDVLGACGSCEAYCWRPSDWAVVEATLA